jgi:antitoxin (DNA-binding transcriptional repressor) of toxin-antitoxin stability system
MESSVTALEMRKKFGSVLDRVVKKGEHVTIMRGHLALAVLIPVKEHEKQCLDKDRLRTVDEVLSDIDAWKRTNPSKAKRLAKTDAAEDVRRMRDRRWSS